LFTSKNLIFIGVVFINTTAFSQLGNLNTQQVGTEGLLMGGALVAAESNSSGLYYNPASISSNTLFSFAFNTAVFRMQFLNFDDAFGINSSFNLISGRFDTPFFSLVLPSKTKYKLKFGFGTFNRFYVDYNFFNRIKVDNPFPELGHTSGQYEGAFSYTMRSNEQWLLMDASKRLSDKFLVGISVIVGARFLTYIKEEYTTYSFKEEKDSKVINASFSNITNAYLYDYKLIFKFGGVFILNEQNRFGLTITAPSISTINNARNYRSVEQTNINLLLDSAAAPGYNDFKVSNFSEDLKANYRSPVSISLGYDRYFGENQIGLSIDFIGNLNPYYLIDSEDEGGDLINTSDSIVGYSSFLNLTFGQRAIVNAAIGYKAQISEKYLLMLGFRTDISATKNVNYTFSQELSSITDIKVNIYYISGGITFTFLNNKFIIGADIGFSSSKKQDSFINYTDPLVINNKGIPLRGNIEPVSKQGIFSLGFVFGYSFKF
jgi:hypothetical protein